MVVKEDPDSNVPFECEGQIVLARMEIVRSLIATILDDLTVVFAAHGRG